MAGPVKEAGPAFFVSPCMGRQNLKAMSPSSITTATTPRSSSRGPCSGPDRLSELEGPDFASARDGVRNQVGVGGRSHPGTLPARSHARLEARLPAGDTVGRSEYTAPVGLELPIPPLRGCSASSREHNSIPGVGNANPEPPRPAAVGLVPNSRLDGITQADLPPGLVDENISSSRSRHGQNQQRRKHQDAQTRPSSPNGGGWAGARM